jgi:hypothetical protein
VKFQEDSQIWRLICKKFLTLHVVELTEQDLEWVTMLIEPEAEDSDTVVERSQLTASALKKGLGG